MTEPTGVPAGTTFHGPAQFEPGLDVGAWRNSFASPFSQAQTALASNESSLRNAT